MLGWGLENKSFVLVFYFGFSVFISKIKGLD